MKLFLSIIAGVVLAFLCETSVALPRSLLTGVSLDGLRKCTDAKCNVICKNMKMKWGKCMPDAELTNSTLIGASPITSKLKVALVESQDISKARNWKLNPDQYSNRVSSLAPSSVAFLKRIGAWQHVEAARVQPYEVMKVWDGVTGSSISFDWPDEPAQRDGSSKTIASMTENANLIRGLLSHVEFLGGDNVSIFSSTKVTSISNGINHLNGPDLSGWPILTLSPSSPAGNASSIFPIAARLLVGADGINSPVRSFAGITTHGWDYDRHGIVATLQLSPQGPNSQPVTAYQRFLPGIGGPIAMLPLPDNHATLVWSTTVQNAAYLKSLPVDAFTAMVNAAFRLSITDLSYMLSLPLTARQASPDSKLESQHQEELIWRLKHTTIPSHVPPEVSSIQSGTVASFPLRHRHASTYISPRISLIGDAAHVIHPLGGLGLNLGVGDVTSLHGAIEYAIQHGMDIGDHLSLERYAADRWMINAGVGGACDILHKMYNVAGHGPFALARGVGLDMVDRFTALKGFIMQRASSTA
ncbi:putative ubiquinone biosynthesis monooxygenase [Myotisia sp. PD_48]|nr:putative ubiquinone biosynthesis monooxygenase [Myotisia sp. PD_48]